MPLDHPLPRDFDDAAVPLPIPVVPAGDTDDCLAPEDLGALDDAELYALEADRCLAPAEWQRVEAELRRRRQSRRLSAADVGPAIPVPPPATLNDLERVSATLEGRLAEQLARLDRRTRALRWWTIAAPLAWGLVGLAVWGLSVHDGAGWSALAAALVD